jgi:diguanylate cyclase (GGDEF)-like protein
MSLRGKTLVMGGLMVVALLVGLFGAGQTIRAGSPAAYLLLALVAGGVAFVGISFVRLDRSILARLSKLSADVRTVGASVDTAAQVELDGDDELSSLARDINGMLQSIDQARRELDAILGGLEDTVAERTAELAHANEQLKAEIDERKGAEARLAHMASHDHLTGLHNRARFEEELELQLAHAERTGHGGAVLWLDLDHFKEINDSLGHFAGDEVLRLLSKRLQAQVRGDTLIARLGGDEFAFLLPDVDREGAEQVSDRLRQSIHDKPFLAAGHTLHMSASIGVVLYPDHGKLAEDLLSIADLAMYQAKEQGRDRVCVYDPALEGHAELRDRLTWAERIEDALLRDRFELWAQQISSFAHPDKMRYELLIRMRDDADEIIGPASFLPVAERLGSIRAIDRWVVAKAIDLLAREAAAGHDTWVDVNVSGRSFADPDLLPLIERKLMETGVDAGRLGIEITETAAILDLGKAREFVDRLNVVGCRFALDDFGSGFSSLAYLRELPIHCLKIDGSYITKLCSNAQDQHMVKAIVELAKGLGVSTVAEFVEDGETLGLLESYGVDFGQGYFIHRPSPLSEVFFDRPVLPS